MGEVKVDYRGSVRREVKERKIFYKRECRSGRKSIFIGGVYVGR
jgi:hypothetical protein